jgi:hypothetical protein
MPGSGIADAGIAVAQSRIRRQTYIRTCSGQAGRGVLDGQAKPLARQAQCRSTTMESPQSGAMANSALAYRARGWSVIPMQPCGKRPLVAWREYQQRIAGEDEIARWFRRWPDANVGAVTGRISDDVVVDVDIRHRGPDSVADAEARNRPLQATVEAATGGGGRHLYCVHPGDVALAPLPPHFGGAGVAPSALGHSRGHWRRLVREGIGEGARNNTIASLSGHLLQRGVDADGVCELMLAWNRSHCRPPLADAQVVRVVESIARLHATEGGSTE